MKNQINKLIEERKSRLATLDAVNRLTSFVLDPFQLFEPHNNIYGEAQKDNDETDKGLLKPFLLEDAKQKAYVATKYYPGFDPSLMTDEEILDWARRDGE